MAELNSQPEIPDEAISSQLMVVENVVFFTVDQAYLPMALTTAAVLAKEESRNFDIVILLDGENDSALTVPPGVRVIPSEIDRMLPARIDIRASWGRVSYARIFGPSVLGSQYRRALYLDSDIAVFGPVSPLFTLEMKGYPLSAVEGMMNETAPLLRGFDLAEYKAGLGVKDGRIFNAGMLLIDIAEWTRKDHGTSLHDYVTDLQPRLRHRTGMAGDQDYLNYAMGGRWLSLSPRWNFQGFLLPYALEELIDPAIVHYGGTRRPWDSLLFPYGSRHTTYYDDGFRHIGMRSYGTIRDRSYYPRFIADQIRQIAHNRLPTSTKRQMFDEWLTMRAAYKRGIEKRLLSGQYEDVAQGICTIDLSADPFTEVTMADVVYYRKHIRLRNSL